ncbi:MAG: preprotein translocase subunit YajC [Treponema sp.]|jgi:preprotein translocase subunit YajC|nr:preprotein translocase subunit YajC [Treponema sp.]
MYRFILPLLMAQGQQANPEAGGPASLLTTIIPFAAIIAIFYFLIIRPQNKKRKETEKMLSALKKGDKVVTIGGIHGIVQSVKESTVIIKVDENVKMEFLRSAVSNIQSSAKEEKIEEKSESSADETPKS